MAAADPKGGEKFYFEGEAFALIRNAPAKTGTEKFFIDGESSAGLLPPTNAETGKMFLEFE